MNAEIDISNVILHTARLTLRPWTGRCHLVEIESNLSGYRENF